jgi:hypothetical protein
VLWNRLIGYNPLRLQKNSFVQILSIVSPTLFLGIFYRAHLSHEGRLHCLRDPPYSRATRFASISLPRHIPGAQRFDKHAHLRFGLVMEY